MKKAIVGLKQSPRAWFHKFSTTIEQSGFKRCAVDHSVFFYKHTSSGCVIIAVYVDDLLITGSSLLRLPSLKEGELVLRKVQQKAGKMAKNWEGPFRIEKGLNQGAHRLQDMDGRVYPRSWNADNLRKFYQ